MKTLRARLLWVALLSLLLATGPGLAQVAAQSDATPSAAGGNVAAYRSATKLQKSAFGPAAGSLVHDANNIAFAPAGVDLYNFFATIQVTAPYDGDQQMWDGGFVFRTGRDADWRVAIYSNGTWDARLGSEKPVADGKITGLKIAKGDTNTIELAVDGDTAYLAINQKETGSFDVSRRRISGDVAFGVTFVQEATKVGAETPYSRFQVWELPDDGAPAAVDRDAADLLEQGRDIADTGDPAKPPISDELTESADRDSIANTGVSEANFYAKADVVNPRDGATNPFDIGFRFRDTGGDNQFRLIFASDGTWYVKYGIGPAIAANRFEGLKTKAGEKNLFEFAASGDQLVFAVNGDVVGNAEIRNSTDPGDVAIGVGFYPEVDVVEGDTTKFTDFAVWSLSAAATGESTKAPTVKKTATATATAESDETTEPTEEPTATKTPEPTREATATKTPEPTHEATATKTPEPTREPTATKTAEPTETTSTPQEIYAFYLNSKIDFKTLYGPESGEMELSADALAYVSSGLDVSDFIAHVDFINPYAASTGTWDAGVLFRLGNGDEHLRLIIVSSGDWLLTQGTGDTIQHGTIDNLKTRQDQTNSIDLVVVGDTGYFGVNGQYVSELDLSSVTGSGDVLIGSSFFQGSYQEGASTGYKNFTIWEIEGDNGEATPTEEATAEPTEASGGKKTPVSGDTYESESYGYSITYPDDWTITDQSSDNGVDLVRFTDGVSTVDVFGYESDLTPQECLDDAFTYYQTADGFSNASIAQDTDNNDMTGDLDDGAWGVYWFTYTPDGGDATDYTAYVECRQLDDGELLKIVQFVEFDRYNDEIDARVALLDGLDLEGGNGAEPTVTPDDEEVTPESGDDVTPESSPTEPALVASIEAVGRNGAQGLATISFDGREATVLVAAFGSGVVDGLVPAIQEGTCNDLSGEAAYELEPIKNGISESTITADYDELLDGDYVITLSESDDTLDDPVGCGEIIG